jgi:hypothetical protein
MVEPNHSVDVVRMQRIRFDINFGCTIFKENIFRRLHLIHGLHEAPKVNAATTRLMLAESFSHLQPSLYVFNLPDMIFKPAKVQIYLTTFKAKARLS